MQPDHMDRRDTRTDAAPPAGRCRLTVATACFWAYLALLTVATHVPRVDPAYLAAVGRVSPLQPDKTLHLAGYGLLGCLAGVAFARGMRSAAVIRLFVALACWAFFDEFTQPFFGRAAELLDWGHDLAGLAFGLACAVAVDRWRESAHRSAGLSSTPERPSP